MLVERMLSHSSSLPPRRSLPRLWGNRRTIPSRLPLDSMVSRWRYAGNHAGTGCMEGGNEMLRQRILTYQTFKRPIRANIFASEGLSKCLNNCVKNVCKTLWTKNNCQYQTTVINWITAANPIRNQRRSVGHQSSPDHNSNKCLRAMFWASEPSITPCSNSFQKPCALTTRH